ncbi:MAG: hypothetical protein K2X48_13455 [Chitinophagaceae bacterium]|nr:hypothetical protein [Chitinophagaceae bacterium]
MQQLIEQIESEYGLSEIHAPALVETVFTFYRKNYKRYAYHSTISEKQQKPRKWTGKKFNIPAAVKAAPVKT